MKLLRELKWKAIMYAVLYILMGIVLLLFPETTKKMLCYAVGGASVVAGVVTVCIYLFRDAAKNTYRNDFVIGLAAILLGVFLIVRVDLIIVLIPFVLGIAVMVSGFRKLQDCIDVRRMGYGNGLVLFLLALISIVHGIILIVNPFHASIVLMRLVGAGLLFCGVSDLLATMYMSRKIKNYIENTGVFSETLDINAREIKDE
ncbi:MAG: DUF308 domain-containing protein [Lachnospiraceae bacterium]|nr:DUF308 domain-containing protein [Lachnospiraceae bacterium]